MIDFVPSDLLPGVLDTDKEGAELSADHHVVVSWVRWRGRMVDRPAAPKRELGMCGVGPGLGDLQLSPPEV